MFGASSGRKLCRDRRLLRILGLSLVGSGPCAHGPPARGRDGAALNPSAKPVDRSPMYTEGSGAQDGVNSGTAVRSAPQRGASERRRRTWTHLSAGVRPKSVHAVEFSKTVAPLLEGNPPQGRARILEPARGGPTSIAPETDLVANAMSRPWGALVRVDQDRTWTTIVRSRGRSSKSMRTTCCQVPRASRPSTIGIVSDGPITAARRWAWELESWLSRLWA